MRIGDNIINIDGTGVVVRNPLRIIGFLGIANADNPSCVIVDRQGNVVYEIASAIAGERYFPMSLPTAAKINWLQVDVWTNMSKILVYIQ